MVKRRISFIIESTVVSARETVNLHVKRGFNACTDSLAGVSLIVMSIKAIGIAIKLTLEGSSQALDTFNTALVSPIYYAMFTSLTILASSIMFKDWSGQSASNIISVLCGFVTVLSGTMVLHSTREPDPPPSSAHNLKLQEIVEEPEPAAEEPKDGPRSQAEHELDSLDQASHPYASSRAISKGLQGQGYFSLKMVTDVVELQRGCLMCQEFPPPSECHFLDALCVAGILIYV
ncbi:hypothetical protein RJ640_013239 [Escallonia rubra]|uniref:Probable magnesium transporter n=1 Tax=Escallonia rubra TaxID=112253 RepID=A0AA88U514_9ASTE|nr:hypothetical protein RJ640_013239 [Escallonia rubra]